MARSFVRLYLLSLLGALLISACGTVSKEYFLAGGGETYSREIVTDPSDAEISLDGAPIGKTPITLSLTAPRYVVTATDPAAAGTIRDPFEASRERGSVPSPYYNDPSHVEYRRALQTLHVLEIRRSGYEDTEITFTMESMQQEIPAIIALQSLRAPTEAKSPPKAPEQTVGPIGDIQENGDSAPKAVQYGYLTIASEPANAEVFVGNELIGSTPLAHVLLEAGTYRLTLKHPGVKDWTYQIEILPRSTTTLHATMEK